MTGFTMARSASRIMPYIYEQEGTRDNSAQWWTDHFDDYDVYMSAGSAGELGRQHGLEQSWVLEKIAGASELRFVVAAAGDGQDSGGAAAESSGDACR